MRRLVLTSFLLLAAPATADECTPSMLGVPVEQATGSTGLLMSGVGQTFEARDSLITSLTVWRVASETPWGVGFVPYIYALDQNGTPDPTQVLYAGPRLLVPEGDGVNPIEHTWEFEPPIALPARGTYALFIFPDPCGGLYVDLPAVSTPGGDAFPGGRGWYTAARVCTPDPRFAYS